MMNVLQKAFLDRCRSKRCQTTPLRMKALLLSSVTDHFGGNVITHQWHARGRRFDPVWLHHHGAPEFSSSAFVFGKRFSLATLTRPKAAIASATQQRSCVIIDDALALIQEDFTRA